MSEKLLPCPFCGREPLIGQTLDNAWYAMCIQDHCCKLESYWRTEAEALTAWNTRTAMQADAEPVAWMYTHEDGSRFFSSIRQNQPFHDMEPRRRNGWTETPLYAHPPVDDRVSTSSPVDDREPENTSDKADTAPAVKSETGAVSDKLRPAVEVWREAWRSVALLSSEHEDVRLNEAVAELHRVIEADREAVRAEQAAEIERLTTLVKAFNNGMPPITSKDAADELIKFKSMIDKLVSNIEMFHDMLNDNYYDFGEAVEGFLSAVEPTLSEYRKTWRKTTDGHLLHHDQGGST